MLHVENYLYCKGTIEVNRADSRYNKTWVSTSQANPEDALFMTSDAKKRRKHSHQSEMWECHEE